MFFALIFALLSCFYSPTFSYRAKPPGDSPSTTLAPELTENCGVDPLDNSETASLFETNDPRRWKWAVRLLVHSRKGPDFKKSLCNGVILDEFNILTAANCLSNNKDDDESSYTFDFVEVMLSVYTGEEEKDETRRWFYIQVDPSKVVTHPNFNEETREFDVAILHLPRPLHMKKRKGGFAQEMRLKPICFTKNYRTEDVDESNCRIIGWEFKRSTKGCEQIELHQEAEVSIFKDETCRKWLKDDNPRDYLNDSMLCYGHKKPNDESVFKGECLSNGAPIQCWGRRSGRWFLAGVGSWNTGCGSEWRPSVATKLAKCYNWIRNNMKIGWRGEKVDDDNEPLRGVEGPTPTTRKPMHRRKIPMVEVYDDDEGFDKGYAKKADMGRSSDDSDEVSDEETSEKDSKPKEKDTKTDANKQNSISGNVNRFGLRLLQELSDGQSNVFQSPFSIAAAMTMLMIGTNGKTFEEIKKTLGYGQDTATIKEEWKTIFKKLNQSDGKNVLAVGNKIIVNPETQVLEKYKSDLKWFDAEIDLNEENIVEKSNEWVKEKTRGMIPEILSQEMKDIQLVILNAIFFQGVWHEEFNKKRTNENDIFYNFGTTEKKVAMMHRKSSTNFKHYDDFGGFKIIELEYKKPENSGPKISMVILLPDSFTGLSTIVNELTIDKLNEFRSEISHPKVEIFLPRFKLQTSYEQLKVQLSKMGIVQAFGKADLSGINGGKNLYVSDVIHKAAIEVDEKGTKAAAATAVVIRTKSSRPRREPDPEKFRADHPFLYFIVDDSTSIILFAGTVNAL